MTLLVTAHVAQSLDGRLAFVGKAASLSTIEGRRSAHQARADNDAVLVGIETIRIDNPELTVRHVEGADPLRVIVSRTLAKVPRDAHALDRDRRSKAKTLIVTIDDDAPAPAFGDNVEVARVSTAADGMVDLRATLRMLEERGIAKLLVEGGARILTSFLHERLLHRLEIEIAMCMLGSPNLSIFGALDVSAIERAPKLDNVTIERLGANLLVRGDVI